MRRVRRARKPGAGYMRSYIELFVLVVFLMAACGASWAASPPSSPPTSPPASAAGPIPATSAVSATNPMEEEYREDEIPDPYGAGAVREEKLVVADPLEPFNRAMHEFNDKLYFWALKPVAQGYKAVVPEPARIGVKNFFSNLGFPARFLSCLLQADFSGAATEAGRFAINTIWGIGGLLDPSSGREIDLQIQDTDLGETLGVYGVGQGFYLVWPVFGPSSPRDTVGLVGERLLDPPTYLSPWYAGTAVGVFEQVNATSLRIGDYESLKNAAIYPYVAFRDAYIQYRLKSVEARKSKRTKSASLEAQSPADGPASPEKEIQ